MPDGRKVRAVFDPRRVDNLKAEAAAVIGEEFVFAQAWEIEPDDGGPYVGQDAWQFWSRPGGGLGEGLPPGIGWVPTEDLRVVEEIRGRFGSD